LSAQFTLQVSADPPRVAYDQTQVNRTTIRVFVRDTQGRPAADLTQVFFRTTLGTLPQQANTQGGQVSIQLENFQQGPGTAMVTIQAGDAQQITQIEFYGPGGPTLATAQKRLCFHIRSKQVYYSTQQKVFDVPADGEFIASGFSVKAGALQFSLSQQLLIAQRNVVVTVGKRTILAESFRYDISAHKGVFLVMDEQMQMHYQTVDELQFKLVDVPDGERLTYKDSFARMQTTPTRYWIISKEAVIYPGQQLHFYRPRFYLNGSNFCFMRMPYHVIFLNEPSDNMFFSGTISLTSDGGIDADFPIYYAANDIHIGSIHLRRVTPGSALYRGTTGFQVGIEEEFHMGMTGDGSLYLDDLTRGTRSITWDENQAFGRVHTSFGASYTRYDDESPYTTSSYLNVSRPFGQFNTSLSTNWSMYEGTNTGLAEISLNPPLIKLGRTRLGLSVNPYVGWQIQQSAATDTTPVASTTNLYQGLRNSLIFPSYPFLKGAFAPSVNDEVAHTQTGAFTNYFDAGLRYQHMIGKFNASLGYTFDLQNSTHDTVSQAPTQSLSFDLFGNRPNWQFYSNSSYNLNTKASYSSANLRYFLPWNQGKDHRRKWYVEYSGSASLLAQTPLIADHLITMGRSMGTYSMLVHYSPSGNSAVTGIGTGTGVHWSVELVRTTW